jgi:cytochrome d ubiquinol oxidase subunit I
MPPDAALVVTNSASSAVFEGIGENGIYFLDWIEEDADLLALQLAIEATAAFFLESTFIGLWVFGWDKVSKKVHALSIWLVAIAANLSALWILLANGWMQRPVGFVLRNGRAR